MNLLRRSSGVLTTLLLLLLASSSVSAKDNWISVRSKNFNLVGNASEKEIKQVATRTEDQYETQRAERASLRTEVSSDAQDPAREQDVKIDPFSYLEEALRKLEAGQSRVQGVLTRIDCSPKAIVFTLKSEQRVYRFSIKNFEEVDITTFTSDVKGELTCGLRKTEDSVIVTYKPVVDKRAKTDGVAIALEFVPKEFKLKKK